MHISCLSWAHNQSEMKKKNRKFWPYKHIESENKCIRVWKWKNHNIKNYIYSRKSPHTSRTFHIGSFPWQKAITRNRKFFGCSMSWQGKGKRERWIGSQRMERAKKNTESSQRFGSVSMVQHKTVQHILVCV